MDLTNHCDFFFKYIISFNSPSKAGEEYKLAHLFIISFYGWEKRLEKVIHLRFARWFEPGQEGRPFSSSYILWSILMDLDHNGSIL